MAVEHALDQLHKQHGKAAGRVRARIEYRHRCAATILPQRTSATREVPVPSGSVFLPRNLEVARHPAAGSLATVGAQPPQHVAHRFARRIHRLLFLGRAGAAVCLSTRRAITCLPCMSRSNSTGTPVPADKRAATSSNPDPSMSGGGTRRSRRHRLGRGGRGSCPAVPTCRAADAAATGSCPHHRSSRSNRRRRTIEDS